MKTPSTECLLAISYGIMAVIVFVSPPLKAAQPLQNDAVCIEILRGGLVAMKNNDDKNTLYYSERLEKECEITQAVHELGDKDTHLTKLNLEVNLEDDFR